MNEEQARIAARAIVQQHMNIGGVIGHWEILQDAIAKALCGGTDKQLENLYNFASAMGWSGKEGLQAWLNDELFDLAQFRRAMERRLGDGESTAESIDGATARKGNGAFVEIALDELEEWRDSVRDLQVKTKVYRDALDRVGVALLNATKCMDFWRDLGAASKAVRLTKRGTEDRAREAVVKALRETTE